MGIWLLLFWDLGFLGIIGLYRMFEDHLVAAEVWFERWRLGCDLDCDWIMIPMG